MGVASPAGMGTLTTSKGFPMMIPTNTFIRRRITPFNFITVRTYLKHLQDTLRKGRHTWPLLLTGLKLKKCKKKRERYLLSNFHYTYMMFIDIP